MEGKQEENKRLYRTMFAKRLIIGKWFTSSTGAQTKHTYIQQTYGYVAKDPVRLANIVNQQC